MDECLELQHRIQTYLSGNVSLSGEEVAALAQEYAALCAEANRRLRLCDSYLNQQMRAEAIAQAQTPPPLLDRAATLDFPDADRWRDVCRQNQLAIAEPIDARIIKRLNQAYEKELPLARLRAVYRIVVYGGGDLSQRIPILRRLAAHDEQSRQELTECETARLRSLEAEVRRAIAGEDLSGLESLEAELASPDWTVRPRARLLDRLRRRIHALRVEQASAEGRRIANEAWEAGSEWNYERTKKAAAKWEALLAKGFFQPSPTLTRNMQQVMAWFEEETARRAAEEAFQQALRDVEEGLDKNLDLAETERRCFALARHKREVDPVLEKQIGVRLEALRRARQRVWRLKLAIGVAASVALAAAIIGALISTSRSRRRNHFATHIRRALDRYDFKAATTLFGELDEHHPRLAQESAFIVLRNHSEQKLREEKKRAEDCGAVLQGLAGLAQEGFPQGSRYGTLAADARTLARKPDETAALERIEKAHLDHVRRVQEEIDGRFNARLKGAIELLEALKQWNPEANTDQNRKYLAIVGRAGKELDAADRIHAESPVSELCRDHARKLRNILNGKYELVRVGKQRMEARERMLARVNDHPDSLVDYETILKTFIEKFPLRPESEPFRKVLANCVLGKDLLRGRRWQGPLDEAKLPQAKEFLESPAGRTSLWRGVLERRIALCEGDARLREVEQALREMKRNPVYTNLCAFVHKKLGDEDDRGKLYYFIDAPEQQGNRLEIDGKIVRTWQIKVFVDGMDPTATRFRIPDSDVRLDHNDSWRPLAPHCKLFRTVCQGLEKNLTLDMLEAHLLSGADRIRTLKEGEPVVQGILAKSFLEQAAKASLDQAAEISRLVRRLQNVNMSVFWMAQKPDQEVLDARDSLKRILGDMTEIKELALRARVRSMIHDKCLERAPVFAGRLRSGEGAWKFELASPNTKELWIVGNGLDGKPSVYIAAETDADGALRIRPAVRTLLLDGMPVFAPSDRSLTSQAVSAIFEVVPADSRELFLRATRWPACWPTNGRTLPSDAKGVAYVR